MNKTSIEYLTHSWNPIAMRCDKVSPACDNCWHLAMCKRQANNLVLSAERRAAAAGGPFVLLDDELDAPSRLRKPARIGVQYMGDLFHEDISYDWTTMVMATIALNRRHVFVVLTKRPERMASYFNQPNTKLCIELIINRRIELADWPLPNLWLGATVENQEQVERIPHLLETPAAVWFLSLEPLLGPVDLSGVCTSELDERCTKRVGHKGRHHALEPTGGWETQNAPVPLLTDWLTIGCETGAHRRPCNLEWVESLIGQADEACVPVFVKKLEINGKVTANPDDWPEWARRREFPK